VTTPAGWYPNGQGAEQYWDGQAWTQQVRPPPGAAAPPTQAIAVPMTASSTVQHAPDVRGGRQFAFDGGAATFFGTGLLAVLITVFTLGICYPFALVLVERWRCKHSFINGQQLVFTGGALALFGLWIKWFLLMIITLGIYSFWVGPRIYRWKWENTGFVGHVVARPA
jgi:uncharacterized membrane protein YjgN (DUF898 family)